MPSVMNKEEEKHQRPNPIFTPQYKDGEVQLYVQYQARL